MGAAEQLEQEFLSVAEACLLLRVDRKTIYALVDKKRLPGAKRFGRVIRIHKPTLLKSLGTP